MNEQVTFIHASDLHIGAPFRGLRAVSPEWADRLSRAIPQAYERLVDLAIVRQVDFVIFAGDTFDSEHPSFSEFMMFVDGLRRLQEHGIPVYICTGNHDPYRSWRNEYAPLPSNAHLFFAKEPGYYLYRKAGTALVGLAGRGFYQREWPQDQDATEGLNRRDMQDALGETPLFAIGVLHTGLDRDASAAPTSVTVLQRMGMDYWALGHIHKPEVVDNTYDPHIVYSGNIQGTAIDERGPRGTVVVTLRKGQANAVEFVSLASVVWALGELDVSECETLDQIVEGIHSTMRTLRDQNGKKDLAVRIRLAGVTPLHTLLQHQQTRLELQQRCNVMDDHLFCESIVDDTEAPRAHRYACTEDTFPALFTTIAQSCQDDTVGAVRYLEECFAANGLQLPSLIADETGVLQREAAQLVLERLQGDSDE